jgi:hypothetical protein
MDEGWMDVVVHVVVHGYSKDLMQGMLYRLAAYIHTLSTLVTIQLATSMQQ